MKISISHYKYCIVMIILLLCYCDKDNPIDICSGFTNEVYKYSFYECTEADSLDCFQKHIESLLLPEQYLKCSSTDRLSRTCLNYPYLPLIWAYTSLQQGFNRIIKIFNGFDELFERDDANIELIKIYQQMDPDSINYISESVERGEFMTQFTFIEITLAQYKLIDKLSQDEVNTLISLCLEQYYKKANIVSFEWIGEMSTLAIIARILESINYEPFTLEISKDPNLELFILCADFLSMNNIEEITQIIITHAENYLIEQNN